MGSRREQAGDDRIVVYLFASFPAMSRFDKKTNVTAQSESNERKWILLFCLLAAVHAFIFSAAFPFFNNVDEQAHFDLVIKYSHGHVPRRLEPVSVESAQYIVTYGTKEYLGDFHGEPVPPPPWTQPAEKVRQQLFADEGVWKKVISWEAAQQPLYYILVGAWWNLGRWLGFEGGHLLYWLRFLNIFFVAALVWLGHLAARLIFPENKFLRLGVPALIAFIPQTAFYSIQNDVLSPLCFGAAFVHLIKFLRAENPGVRLGVITGLILAATFLTKTSNLPLLAVSALVILFKAAQLARAGKFRAALPSLAALGLCAALPTAAWLAWTKYAFGDFTGSAAKIALLNWTCKPFAEWWHHPIYTPHGLWTFLSGLMATFWQGEIMWHRMLLILPGVSLFYAITSIGLIITALIFLAPRFNQATKSQRQALWAGFGCVAASVAFLGFLSTIYDFGDCFYPSREHPYFTSGRLMLGALIPFLLLFLFGLDRLLDRAKNNWLRPLVLTGLILFMFISEIATDWPVFSSQYNWFHM
jgi:Predicted membrane protein (DUF2142)